MYCGRKQTFPQDIQHITTKTKKHALISLLAWTCAFIALQVNIDQCNKLQYEIYPFIFILGSQLIEPRHVQKKQEFLDLLFLLTKQMITESMEKKNPSSWRKYKISGIQSESKIPQNYVIVYSMNIIEKVSVQQQQNKMNIENQIFIIDSI